MVREGKLPKVSKQERKPEIELSEEFRKSATNVALACDVSIKDVQSTYAENQTELSALYNEMNTAKNDRQSWMEWSAACLVVLPPVMLYTAYKAYESHEKLRSVKKQVQAEVACYKPPNN